MSLSEQRQSRLNEMTRREIDIWNTLIGAHGSPTVQKYTLLPRMYGFVRTIVNMEHDNPDREAKLVHNYAKNSAGKKLRDFIDFIDGRTSIDDAKSLRDKLIEDLKTALKKLP